MKIEYINNTGVKTVEGDKVAFVLNEARVTAQKQPVATIPVKDLYSIGETSNSDTLVITEPICNDDGMPYGGKPRTVTKREAADLIEHLRSMVFMYKGKEQEEQGRLDITAELPSMEETLEYAQHLLPEDLACIRSQEHNIKKLQKQNTNLINIHTLGLAEKSIEDQKALGIDPEAGGRKLALRLYGLSCLLLGLTITLCVHSLNISNVLGIVIGFLLIPIVGTFLTFGLILKHSVILLIKPPDKRLQKRVDVFLRNQGR